MDERTDKKKTKKRTEQQNPVTDSKKEKKQKAKPKSSKKKKARTLVQPAEQVENFLAQEVPQGVFPLSDQPTEQTFVEEETSEVSENERRTSSVQDTEPQDVFSFPSASPALSSWDIWLQGVGAGSLLLYASTARSWKRAVSLALGGALLYRAWRSYRKHQRRFAETEMGGQAEEQGLLLEQTLFVKQSPAEVYSFFRSFKNLKKWLGHEGHVREVTPQHIQWTVESKDRAFVQFDAEIIADVPRKLIAWRSAEGSTISHEGSVHFRAMAEGKETEVHVMLKFDPPAGNVVTALFEEHPMEVLSQGLTQVKRELERTEVSELASV